ncbi:MAG: GNAT family N-acetyltransferase [Acidimicrobiales bacterium]
MPATEPVVVRPVTEEDLDRVVELLQQLHPELPVSVDGELARETFRAVSAQRGRSLLVADVAGQGVVGTVDMVLVPNLSHGALPYAFVENMVVDEPWRSRGVGEALMRAVIERAEAAGCFKVQLDSLRTRARAHAFYERLGFEPLAVGLRRYAPGHHPSPGG